MKIMLSVLLIFLANVKAAVLKADADKKELSAKDGQTVITLKAGRERSFRIFGFLIFFVVLIVLCGYAMYKFLRRNSVAKPIVPGVVVDGVNVVDGQVVNGKDDDEQGEKGVAQVDELTKAIDAFKKAFSGKKVHFKLKTQGLREIDLSKIDIKNLSFIFDVLAKYEPNSASEVVDNIANNRENKKNIATEFLSGNIDLKNVLLSLIEKLNKNSKEDDIREIEVTKEQSDLLFLTCKTKLLNVIIQRNKDKLNDHEFFTRVQSMDSIIKKDSSTIGFLSNIVITSDNKKINI